MSREKRPYAYLRAMASMLLCAYFLFMSRRMFFYAYGSYYRSFNALPEYNLIPFRTIENLIVNYKYYELDAWIYNLFGNVAAFMPLGFLLPIVSGAKKKLRVTVLLSFALLLMAEAAQLIFRVGVFDVDDIILNMLGVIFGYMVYIMISRVNKAK